MTVGKLRKDQCSVKIRSMPTNRQYLAAVDQSQAWSYSVLNHYPHLPPQLPNVNKQKTKLH